MTFIRYVIIQLMGYVLDMGGFLLILKMDIFGPVIANLIGKSAAGIFAFIAHRNFTFRSNEPADKKSQAIRYFVGLALYIPFSTGVLSLLLIWIKEPEIAKFLADVIGVGISYLISKKLIFTKLPAAKR
ncbi:GtrA family protein [Oceanospirillaceae bacterium]|nr:GtrA family protein [Oceanospirillaceae bacterium]